MAVLNLFSLKPDVKPLLPSEVRLEKRYPDID